MACDPNQLSKDASCFLCIDAGMQGAIMIALLCQIRDAGIAAAGTVGGGAGAPTAPPANPNAYAVYLVDSLTDMQTWGWSVAFQQWVQIVA